MASSHPDSDPLEQLAELLVHIGRSARAEGRGDILTAAQWTALRFFARANRASRTPSALASFQATTRGTASQTIKTLVQGGLLERRASDTDGRSARFEVTARGRDILAGDPLCHLVSALGGLQATDRDSLKHALPQIAAQLARHRDTGGFGTCDACRYFETRDGTSYCACAASDLAPFEIGKLCARFSPGPQDRPACASPRD